MEQACTRGYRGNATKPKASSTRQSDWRVRLPTVTHTTKKDSTVLLPSFTNNLNLLSCLLEQWICSVQPQNAELICAATGRMTCAISDDMFYISHVDHSLSGPYVNILKISTPNPTHWFISVEKVGVAAVQSPQLQPKWSPSRKANSFTVYTVGCFLWHWQHLLTTQVRTTLCSIFSRQHCFLFFCLSNGLETNPNPRRNVLFSNDKHIMTTQSVVLHCQSLAEINSI